MYYGAALKFGYENVTCFDAVLKRAIRSTVHSELVCQTLVGDNFCITCYFELKLT